MKTSIISMLSPLLRIMTCPLIALHSMKAFAVETFTNCPETVNVFNHERSIPDMIFGA